jgi:hypothetical protein
VRRFVNYKLFRIGLNVVFFKPKFPKPRLFSASGTKYL